MTDPWRDCERFYDMHFLDRMRERHLPLNHIEEALLYGDKITEAEKTYRVRWNKWTIVVVVGRCFVYLLTAYLER